MKKLFVILGILLLFAGSNAFANSYTNFLDSVSNVLNVIDRTEYVGNRINRRINQVQNATQQNNVQVYQKNQQQKVNYNNSNQYYNTDIEAPEYTQTQPTVPEGNYKYNQNRTYTGNARTLGELPQGTIVMDPNSVWNFRNGLTYSGNIEYSHPIFWKKLEDNHYAQGTTLLLSEIKVANYPFCHRQKGLRAWDESDVRRFLRTTFYTHLSQGFKNAIVNVNIPFADLTGKPKTVQDNFFLLSIVEWGLSDRANNGTVIKYNDLPDTYAMRLFDYLKSDDMLQMSKSSYFNMTRTINRPVAKSAGYDRDVFSVTSHGTLTTRLVYTSDEIRPAVNIKSSTPVQGPYSFKTKWKKDNFVYYVLTF